MLTFFHPSQKLHYPDFYFSRGQMRKTQEVPNRIPELLAAVDKLGFTLTVPKDFGMDVIKQTHDEKYLNFLQNAYQMWHAVPEDWGMNVMSNIYIREPNSLQGVLAQAARFQADGSCPIDQNTWESAYWSAQSALAAAQTIKQGEREVYALCRPPGHHARRDAAGGFCYLNNAAIAANSLLSKFSKVVILDTDMHHGQGIQEIFYTRKDVYYVSIHADPVNFYPVVAGHANETGRDEGLNYNLNYPLKHGSTEEVFFSTLKQANAEIAKYKPEALILCLGFDIYYKDVESRVAVTEAGFTELGKQVGMLGLPTLIVQEGGYFIESLNQNAQAFFKGFQENHK